MPLLANFYRGVYSGDGVACAMSTRVVDNSLRMVARWVDIEVDVKVVDVRGQMNKY
jgi:hypothetical protein